MAAWQAQDELRKIRVPFLARNSTMIDEMTQSNLRVSNDGTAGPSEPET